jgi:hypothetical protein
MKTIYKFFTLVALLAATQAHAAIITVSNRPGDIAQFTEIGNAINAAAEGDIIYVSGSATSYGNFTVGKRLTFIGSGHNPNNDNQLVSQFGTITLGVGSSGSEIIGFRINILTWSASAAVINNINIQRCSFSSTIFINGNSREWIIQENVLDGIQSASSASFEQNLIFRNNIFKSVVNDVRHSLFTNNIFLWASVVFNDSDFNTFTNNIFYQNNLNSSISNGNISNCVFNNNISFGGNNPTLPAGNNTGQGNFFADPQFVNVTSNTFSYDFDYSLQGSSPGINAGADGTDIGLFGGVGYSISGTPAIPEVTELNVLNPIVPQNGSLNLRIRGRANN